MSHLIASPIPNGSKNIAIQATLYVFKSVWIYIYIQSCMHTHAYVYVHTHTYKKKYLRGSCKRDSGGVGGKRGMI